MNLLSATDVAMSMAIRSGVGVPAAGPLSVVRGGYAAELRGVGVGASSGLGGVGAVGLAGAPYAAEPGSLVASGTTEARVGSSVGLGGAVSVAGWSDAVGRDVSVAIAVMVGVSVGVSVGRCVCVDSG